MKRYAWIFLTAALFLHAVAVPASTATQSDGPEAADARQALSDILDLWRAERFEDLYARTIPAGNRGEYYFLEKMVNSLRKPACCWEKLRDVKAAYVSRDRVILIATVGMEMDGAGIKYITQSFSLRLVDGIWKIPMETIVSLSDSTGYRAIPRDIIEKPLP